LAGTLARRNASGALPKIGAKRGLAGAMQKLLTALAFLGSPYLAANTFENRPAFSAGDLPPERHAACEEVRSMSAGLEPSETRIDLAVEGRLTLVRTDGVLWYLVMCSDVRVMCVTYQGNDMKAGDRVAFKGGY
jgi:hypothetical protein